MATLRSSLPRLDMKFVVGAIAAAGVVALARFVIMRAPTNQLTAPVKKVAEQL